MSEDVAVEVGPARPADAAALLEFWQREVVPCDLVTSDRGLEQLTATELGQQFDALAASPNNLLLVVKADGALVGYLRIAADDTPQTRHVGELGLLVAADWRHLGLGRLLMSEALHWVATQSILRRVQLVVQTRNQAAQQLYREFNFEHEGHLRASYCSQSGELLDTELMARLFE